jgi:hypothetical protein
MTAVAVFVSRIAGTQTRKVPRSRGGRKRELGGLYYKLPLSSWCHDSRQRIALQVQLELDLDSRVSLTFINANPAILAGCMLRLRII